MNRFYFKKYLPIYKALDKICIGFVGRKNEYIEIKYNQQNLAHVEKILKEGISENELEDKFYATLNEKNFLSHIYQSSKDNRSDLYLEYLFGNGYSKAFLNKKILIFGAGAGGSSLTYMLAQFGFKNIFLIDYDFVEDKDLNRISIFKREDIGRKKVDVLKEKISFNFSTEIKILDAKLIEYQELEKTIKSYSPELIVKACDPKGIFLINLNTICFQLEIPYIMMAYSYEKVKIGPILIPKVTSCAESVSYYAEKLYGKHHRFEYFERLFSDYLFHPSVPFNINLLASLVFKEILFFLKEEFELCHTIGRQMIFNPLTMSFDNIIIKCHDECSICKY